MATGFPVKANYATGDILTATNMNDLAGTVNYAVNTTPTTATQMAGKNAIINGDFGIWQRGTSISLSSAGRVYGADRFNCQSNFSAGTSTFSQQTFTAGTAPIAGYEGTYYGRLTAGSTATYFDIGQKIEDVRTYAGQAVTFSFWAKASASTAMSILLQQNFGSGGSTSVDNSSAITITTSWTRYTYTVTLGSLAGKTIGTSSYLAFFLLTTGAVTGSQTFDIWGVQLESGSSATPFQTATGTKQGELAACQRYYYRQTGDNLYTSFGNGTCNATTTALINVIPPVTMRVKPSAVDFSTLRVYDGSVGQTVTAVTLNTDSSGAAQPQINATIGSALFTLARNAFLQGNNSASAYIGFSAEL
jgi:hypothetical protein